MTTQPLIVCPFCETQQPNAWDCVSCGRPLHERPKHVAVPLQAVEGIEHTALVEDGGGNVAVGEVEGLELTALVEGASVPAPAELVPELETTALSDLKSVAVVAELVPELELTRLDEPEASPVSVAAVTCRYCATPWQPGASQFCARCGMRLSIPAALLQKPAAAAVKRRAQDEGSNAICSACGARDQTPGHICVSCGQLVRGKG